jgi:hypothetical protein
MPIRSLRRANEPVKADFVEFSLAEVDARLAGGFQSVSSDLATLGFNAIAHLRKAGRALLDSHVSIWIHPVNQDVAVISVVRRKDGVPISSVGFVRQYADESSVVTSNSIMPSLVARNPKVASVRLAGFWNVPRLYEIHRAWVKHQPAHEKVAVIPKDGVSYMQEQMTRQLKHQIAMGYYRLTADQQSYRVTLKGACFMTWKQLSPWKQTLRSKRLTKTNRILRELGFGDLQALLDSQLQR